MPMFYFNVLDEIRSNDLFGSDLPDLAAAKIEAAKDIADIKRARFETIGNNDWATFSIEICDRDKKVLFVIPFSPLLH